MENGNYSFKAYAQDMAGHVNFTEERNVNINVLGSIFEQNSLLGVFSALTGGSMERFSIVLMGLAPYINASIIMQLMTVVIPKLEVLSKEGMEGRRHRRADHRRDRGPVPGDECPAQGVDL